MWVAPYMEIERGWGGGGGTDTKSTLYINAKKIIFKMLTMILTTLIQNIGQCRILGDHTAKYSFLQKNISHSKSLPPLRMA